jgi:hypothetical protein
VDTTYGVICCVLGLLILAASIYGLKLGWCIRRDVRRLRRGHKKHGARELASLGLSHVSLERVLRGQRQIAKATGADLGDEELPQEDPR